MVEKREAGIKRPEVKIELDPLDLMVHRLACDGFCGGDPQRILDLPSDLVLQHWDFVRFQSEYEETLLELNKPE